jgi:hypothetical protein
MVERQNSFDSGGLVPRALMIGVVGLALCAVGGVLYPAPMLRSYLVAYNLFLGIALGCLPLLMLYHLVGGHWGRAIRRLLEAATRTLPLLALLFVPLLFGLPELYRWAGPGALNDPDLAHEALYLNVPAFIGRAVFYFVVWIILELLLNRWSRRQDATGDPRLSGWLAMLSGPGIVLYGLTVTFASIDWIMSLSPDWFSTIFPVIYSLGQILSAFAFAVMVATWLAPQAPLSHVLTGLCMRDLGNLLLTFVMFWAYVSFSQFLLMWCGNLPEEIRWYVPRFQSGWQVFGWALVACQFALPFVLLLSRDIKQNPRMLCRVAALILVMRLVDLFWQVVPNFAPGDLLGHALEFVGSLVAIAGVGGVWLAAFVWQVRKMPLLPVHDMERQPEFLPEAHHE